jgi:hypothetical protein
VAVGQAAEPSRDARKLAADIDRLINARLAAETIPASPSADDAEFLRRVYLDLTGRIPTAEKATAFLESKDPEKRSKLIDELLASSDYGQHFGNVWRNLVIRRDANMIRPPDTEPFARWLADNFNQNRGWDKLVSELLTVEGSTVEKPQGVYFVLNGDSRGNPEANIIASSTVQLFLGVQMQCAECHDHPFAPWKQSDYWGVAAFFGKVKNAGAAKGGAGGGITESGTAKAGKGAADTPKVAANASIIIPSTAFKSVGKVVKAKFPQGAEPKLQDSESFRPAFAQWLTSPENKYFAPNAVNRLWAHLLGKGFVTPVNDFSADNPPSHPELLELLAKEFIAAGYDQKHLIRCICNSRTYQRTSQPLAANKMDNRLFSHVEVKVMSSDVLYTSLTIALERKDLFAAPAKAPAAKKGQPQATTSGMQQFLTAFNTKEDGADATEFSHGIPQALRLMNQLPFNSGGAIVERLVKSGKKSDEIIRSLFLATLSRLPSDEEMQELTTYVARKKNTHDVYCGVLWTLVNRSEFILNH